MTDDDGPRWRRQEPLVADRCGTAAHGAHDAGEDGEIQAQLAVLVGKRILVGITYVTRDGELIEQVQTVGTIVRATLEDGIEIEKEDGSGILSLPPAPEEIYPADQGHYRLRSTGEVVVDPDLVTTWELTKGPEG